MLDYSILNKDDKNFTKTVEKFDIREAIEEIVEIQMDKINMKTISVEKHFEGFEGVKFKIASDIKRIQQIFLNLLSNAVKFTDRNG